MTRKDYPRAVMTTALVGLFAYAYASNPHDEMMKGALIAAFSMAAQYWLGSSKGSADKSSQIEHITDQASGKSGDPIHVTPEDER